MQPERLPQAKKNSPLISKKVALEECPQVILMEIELGVSLLFSERSSKNKSGTEHLELNFLVRLFKGEIMVCGLLGLEKTSEKDGIWVVRCPDNGRVLNDPSYLPYESRGITMENFLMAKEAFSRNSELPLFYQYLDLFAKPADGGKKYDWPDGYAGAGKAFPNRWKMLGDLSS